MLPFVGSVRPGSAEKSALSLSLEKVSANLPKSVVMESLSDNVVSMLPVLRAIPVALLPMATVTAVASMAVAMIYVFFIFFIP